MRNYLLSAVGLAVTIGCSGGSSSYVPKPPPKIEPVSLKAADGKNLFPFKVGNSWTFATKTVQRVGTKSQQKEIEATFKVAKVEETGGNTRATIELIIGKDVVDRQTWISNGKGIFQVNIGLKNVRQFSTPIPAIVFPIEPGKRFSWSGSDGKSKMAYNSEILGAQEVDTDMKRMSAIAIESKGTSVNGKVTEKTDRTIWFAPKIGIVRIRESTSSTVGASELLLTLKSHNVK
ncbi:MAG: hypothetical protein H7Y17_14140 [Chlorobia bacterium]|nr:hypothetical protein [Fimbriimonadaceae bacterium]